MSGCEASSRTRASDAVAVTESAPPSSKLCLQEDFDPDLSRQTFGKALHKNSTEVPLLIHLHESEVTTVPPPRPVQISAPRLSYLPSLLHLIKSRFSSTLPPCHQVWFEYKGIPLDWNIRIGKLFDSLCNESEVPWNLKIHFSGCPTHLQPMQGRSPHGTTILGLVVGKYSAILIAADSQVQAELDNEIQIFHNNQKIFQFGGRFVIGCCGNVHFYEEFVSRLMQMAFPESLDACIQHIWADLMEFKVDFLNRIGNENAEDLMGALIGGVDRTPNGHELRLWLLDDDLPGPVLKTKFGCSGSGRGFAEAELTKGYEAAQHHIDLASELCLRGIYRASFRDPATGGNASVMRIRAPTIIGGAANVQPLLATEATMANHFSRNGTTVIDVDDDKLLPTRRKPARIRFIQGLLAHGGVVEHQE